MRESRASSTATWVSVARGVGISATLRDPLAHVFHDRSFATTVARLGSAGGAPEASRYVLRAMSLGLVDHNTLRMVLVDRYLAASLRDGVRQVVVLGAGLDTRAWRFGELASSRVFEVDHPATQADKRSRAALLPRAAQALSFVPVDFETDDVASALERHGHRVDQPTSWICEGVLAYLTPAAIEALFACVSERSARGSRLVASYVTPPGEDRGRASKALIRLILKRAGEHVRGFLSQDAARALVEGAGLVLDEDLDWEAWKARVPEYQPLPNLFKERLIVASRS